jgi:hypothetical protein
MSENKIAPGDPLPSDNSHNVLALKELAEKRRANNITLIGFAVTLTICLISLTWNAKIQKQASRASEVLETTRVENNDVVTNTNDFANPWVPWIDTVSPTTVHLGVARDIKFERPFRNPPHISLGLRGLDVPDMTIVLTRLGFRPGSPRLADRIRHVHVTTDVGNVSTTGFRMLVGIGLPSEPAKFLQRQLQDADLVDREVVADMRTAGMLENHDVLTSDEIWMSNFYTVIGTFQVAWIAQGEEDHAKP